MTFEKWWNDNFDKEDKRSIEELDAANSTWDYQQKKIDALVKCITGWIDCEDCQFYELEEKESLARFCNAKRLSDN